MEKSITMNLVRLPKRNGGVRYEPVVESDKEFIQALYLGQNDLKKIGGNKFPATVEVTIRDSQDAQLG